jgi:pimeloyl-ACP methyl ester carboxylesterase
MDIENFYIEYGNGFPFILLHGNGENSSYFERQIGEFSKYYNIFAIDTRGHGKTSRGNKPFTINQFAHDLFEFMNKKNIEKAHILGFSDGGNIAIVFSILYPERVEKLILNGANLYPGGLTNFTQISDKIEYYRTRLFSKNILKKEMLELMVYQPNISPDELSKIKSKTLVIVGTKDLIKKTHTELIANKIPNSKLVFIDGDYFIVYKKSDEFNKIVLDFIKKE